MELYASRVLSNLPHHRSSSLNPPSLRSQLSFIPKRASVSFPISGFNHFASHLLRATKSDETSISMSGQLQQTPDEAIAIQELHSEKMSYATRATKEAKLETAPNEAMTTEETPVDVRTQIIEYLNQLNVKLSSGDVYTLLAYGSGASVVLWISSAIVSAIDSIPLVPKVLEIIGLAFTIWFSYRYVIFKKNRDELSVKIEELKQQIIGPTDD